MKNTNKYLFFLLLGLPLVASSQTTNVGDLYISPATIMSTVGAFDNKNTGDFINDGQFVVYSHYSNEGIATFTPSATPTGLTQMKGVTGVQEISGTSPIDCKDIEFDTAAAESLFDLTNKVHVFGNANFIRGVVNDDNATGLLIFEPAATSINESDNSHVDGFVEKKGIESFKFPIGNRGVYVYSKISDGAQSTNSYLSKFRYEDSNTLYPHDKKDFAVTVIDNQEYWVVSKVAPTENAQLTLSLNERTTSAEVYADPKEDIHIVGFDATQSSWVDLGGTYDDVKMEITTSIQGLDNCKIFTFARVNASPDLIVHDVITPNGDGKNDYVVIEGIENYPDNSIQIFNRWGAPVYDREGYNNDPETSFRGFSTASNTVNSSKKLPDGVYFYILKYANSQSVSHDKKGYIYIGTKN